MLKHSIFAVLLLSQAAFAENSYSLKCEQLKGADQIAVVEGNFSFRLGQMYGEATFKLQDVKADKTVFESKLHFVAEYSTSGQTEDAYVTALDENFAPVLIGMLPLNDTAQRGSGNLLYYGDEKTVIYKIDKCHYEKIN